MIKIGGYNTLHVVRSTSVGVFLHDGAGTEILLPNKYVPKDIQINQELRVFCYLDHEERPVATTLSPSVIRGQFAHLKVAQLTKVGAFLDWGLEKQLLVPFIEQRERMIEGQSYLVYCFLDPKTFRLVASSKIDKFLSKVEHQYAENDSVDLLIARKTNIGWEVIIDNAYKGLLFYSDVFRTLKIGDKRTGFIKRVRRDRKIDVSLEPIGSKMLNVAADHILEELRKNDGFLPLHDKSSPNAIKGMLEISKKAFKKGIGVLYKQRKIVLLSDGIQLKK